MFGKVYGTEAPVNPPLTDSAPYATVSCRCIHLLRSPATNLKLVWINGHDKLGVRVTQESHKVPW
jgi:hypothetical protein